MQNLPNSPEMNIEYHRTDYAPENNFRASTVDSIGSSDAWREYWVRDCCPWNLTLTSDSNYNWNSTIKRFLNNSPTQLEVRLKNTSHSRTAQLTSNPELKDACFFLFTDLRYWPYLPKTSLILKIFREIFQAKKFFTTVPSARPFVMTTFNYKI